MWRARISEYTEDAIPTNDRLNRFVSIVTPG